MKVEWVRIKDFRSIEDTDKLYIDSLLTVLAGKNESGKSNILRALEVFSTGRFSIEDYPEGKSNEEIDPMVEVSFRLNLRDIENTVVEDKGYTPFHQEKYYNFIISKPLDESKIYTYGSIQRYFFNKRFINLMEMINESLIVVVENSDIRSSVRKRAESLYKLGHSFFKNFLEQETPIYWLMDYRENLNDILKFMNVDDKINKKNVKSTDLTFPSEVLDQFMNLSRYIYDQYKYFEENVVIPKFKLLESFERPLPDSVSLFNEDGDVWTKYIQDALEGTEGGSVSEISNREIKRGLDRLSKETTSLFQNVYSQSRIKLELDLGVHNTVDIYIYDDANDIDFLPSQRSKGFQWFLSFFFAINTVQRTGDIILLDEPGPYLHPKAQNDILKALEILAQSDQIIFTTHSPYLINPNNLERVRLVTRNIQNHTVTENQIHASSVADQEVYTPIMTAIGLDLSKSFGAFGEHNIIVEGISDYYYLESMKKYINYNGESDILRFIPSIGASQIDKLASLLIGWGVNFKVLLDNDNAGNNEKKELEQKLFLSEEQMVFVSDNPGFAIEDLFSREDFLKYIMPDLKISEQEKRLNNSRLFKGKSKALFAKMFKEQLQKEPDIKFTSQTVDNFTVLFQKLYGVNDVEDEVMESVK